MGEVLTVLGVLGLIVFGVHRARAHDREVAAARAMLRDLTGRAEVLERAARRVNPTAAALYLARARGLREDARRAERTLRRLGAA